MKPSLLFATLLLAFAAQAQTVWRCGADGRSYSAQPCTDGRVVAAADTRTAAESGAARDVAARDRALARDLAQQRQRYEAQVPVMAGISQARPPAVKSKASKKPSKKPSKKASTPPEAPGIWLATAPVSR
jgi:hypothetical protein